MLFNQRPRRFSPPGGKFDRGRFSSAFPRAESVPPWSPQTGVRGLLFLADWISPKYQNVALTTPASADADPVYKWGTVAGQAADSTRPLLTSSGPSPGKSALRWDGANARNLSVSGGFMAGSTLTMACVYKSSTPPADSQLCGRGGASGNGFRFYINSSGSLVSEVATAGGVSSVHLPSATGGTWKVAAMTYTSATSTARALVRGGTALSNADMGATPSGALSYAGGDTAFAVGASTTDGTISYFYGAKDVALVLVTSAAYDSVALLTSLVNNIASYAGIL